jgi:hypothetical protein
MLSGRKRSFLTIPATFSCSCATNTTFNSESYLTSRHTTPENKNKTMGYVLRQIYAIAGQMLHTAVFKNIQLLSSTQHKSRCQYAYEMNKCDLKLFINKIFCISNEWQAS